MGELVQALKNENLDLKTLAGIIGKDPSMSVNILKIANSALYSLPNKVTSIDHAVTLLGMREIASLCLSCGIGNVLKPPAGTTTMDMDIFWKHSIATGIIGKILCKEFKIYSDTNLYLAGLIHDVGKIVLDRFAHNIYKSVQDYAFEQSIPVLEAESRIIGETHGTVGGWLMEKWQLPRIFIDVASYHHSAASAPEESSLEVSLISIADELSWMKDLDLADKMTMAALVNLDAFQVLQQRIPSLRDTDISRPIFSFDSLEEEVAAMEKMVTL